MIEGGTIDREEEALAIPELDAIAAEHDRRRISPEMQKIICKYWEKIPHTDLLDYLNETYHKEISMNQLQHLARKLSLH